MANGLQFGHDARGMVQNLTADLRDHHSAPMAFEQKDAKLFFQKPDLATQRRLRDVQAIGSLAQASEFGNMDQGLQLNNIHRRILQHQSLQGIADFERSCGRV